MRLRDMFNLPLSSDDIGDALVILICVIAAAATGVLAWMGKL